MDNKELICKSLPGLYAAGIQISSLFWLKTTIKNQYYNGTTTTKELVKLYKDPDIFRFYRGFPYHLLAVSSSRFADTIMYNYLNQYENISNQEKSLYIGSFSLLIKINLIPLDTITNIYQIHGKNGLSILKKKIKNNNYKTLYNGTNAFMITQFISTSSWFYSMDTLNSYFYQENEKKNNVIKNGCIGLLSSLFTSLLTNPIRILKTYKQSYKSNISYYESFNDILSKDNFLNFYFRGFGSRLLFSGLNNSLFFILWKSLDY